jgi:hypothetical protein
MGSNIRPGGGGYNPHPVGGGGGTGLKFETYVLDHRKEYYDILRMKGAISSS